MISFLVTDGNVLDLFAGSGALGIEALSRGFSWCDFCDADPLWVKKNVEKCRLSNECNIVKSDYEAFLLKTDKKYSLVFLDPPYHKGYVERSLSILCERQLLENGSVIVVETDSDEVYKIPEKIEIAKEKCYGRIKILIGVYHK